MLCCLLGLIDQVFNCNHINLFFSLNIDVILYDNLYITQLNLLDTLLHDIRVHMYCGVRAMVDSFLHTIDTYILPEHVHFCNLFPLICFKIAFCFKYLCFRRNSCLLFTSVFSGCFYKHKAYKIKL